MAGRKSLKQEVGVLKRYSALSVPYFRFLEKMLSSNKITDQKWAAEQLRAAFVKMIPEIITGTEGQPLIVKMVNFSATAKNSIPQ